MSETESARRLDTRSASALVIANMVGAGVFTTSGFALGDLGSPHYVLLAWVIGGAVALCGALSYGALARRHPDSGGEYLFLSRMVHPLAGFLAGWVSLLAGFTAPIAAAGLGLQAYLGETFAPDLRPEWIGSGAIALAGAIHAARDREGVWIQNLAVATKLVLIFGFIAFGFSALPERPPTTVAPDSFPVGAFAVTLVWISFSYAGWNAAVYIGGEVRDPERTLPRSLLLGTGVVTVLYLGLNAVFVYSAPVDALAFRPDVGAVAAEAIGGPGLRKAVSLVVALALFTSIWAMVMAGPRVYAKMAEDGLFPASFRSDGGTPVTAIALQTGAAICVVWWSGLADLLGYIGFTLGLSSAATVAALLVTRMREGGVSDRGFGQPWIGLLFIAMTLYGAGFMIQREPVQAAIGLGTALAGIPVYYLFARRGAASSNPG